MLAPGIHWNAADTGATLRHVTLQFSDKPQGGDKNPIKVATVIFLLSL